MNSTDDPADVNPASVKEGLPNLWTAPRPTDSYPQPRASSLRDRDDIGFHEGDDPKHFGPEGKAADPTMEKQCIDLATAVARCRSLRQPSPELDHLWLVMQDTICTRGRCSVTPLGSSTDIEVTEDLASVELIEAMTWLLDNEGAARRLPPTQLRRRLRAAATKGAHGSARSAQLESLHGLTNVPAKGSIGFTPLDDDA